MSETAGSTLSIHAKREEIDIFRSAGRRNPRKRGRPALRRLKYFDFFFVGCCGDTDRIRRCRVGQAFVMAHWQVKARICARFRRTFKDACRGGCQTNTETLLATLYYGIQDFLFRRGPDAFRKQVSGL